MELQRHPKGGQESPREIRRAQNNPKEVPHRPPRRANDAQGDPATSCILASRCNHCRSHPKDPKTIFPFVGWCFSVFVSSCVCMVSHSQVTASSARDLARSPITDRQKTARWREGRRPLDKKTHNKHSCRNSVHKLGVDV